MPCNNHTHTFLNLCDDGCCDKIKQVGDINYTQLSSDISQHPALNDLHKIKIFCILFNIPIVRFILKKKIQLKKSLADKIVDYNDVWFCRYYHQCCCLFTTFVLSNMFQVFYRGIELLLAINREKIYEIDNILVLMASQYYRR